MTASVTGAAIAVKRSQAYGFFAAVMEYPEGELTALIRAGKIAERARELLCSVYPDLGQGADWNLLRDAGTTDDLSVEYTRLFNMPGTGSGPLCSLNSRAYDCDAPLKLLEELVRFYNYFGLTSGDAPANELPDHFTTQFEFLHFLCHQEAIGEEEAMDDYRRAQRDFLERHPGKWIPMWHERLRESNAHPFYCTIGKLLNRFIQLEQQYVSRLSVPSLTN